MILAQVAEIVNVRVDDCRRRADPSARGSRPGEVAYGPPMAKKSSKEVTQPSAIAARRRAALEVPKAGYVDRRTTILQRAAETFRERGVGTTTMDDIAKVAQLDRSSLYYYFSNKEELLPERRGDLGAQSGEHAEAGAGSDGPAATRLDRLVRELVGSYASTYPNLFIFVDEYILRRQLDDSDWATRVREWGRRYEAAIASVITQGGEDGSLGHVGDPRTVARAIVGMVNSMAVWYSPHGRVDGQAVAEIMSGLVLDGLRR